MRCHPHEASFAILQQLGLSAVVLNHGAAHHGPPSPALLHHADDRHVVGQQLIAGAGKPARPHAFRRDGERRPGPRNHAVVGRVWQGGAQVLSGEGRPSAAGPARRRRAVQSAWRRRHLPLHHRGLRTPQPGVALRAPSRGWLGDRWRGVWEMVVSFRARPWCGTVEWRNSGGMTASRQATAWISLADASLRGRGRRGLAVGEFGGRRRDGRC